MTRIATDLPRQCGFTLLEVLVALTILAIAMAAVIKAAGDGARIAEHLEGNTMAHLIAVDEMNRLRLSGDWPDIGITRGTFEIEDGRWHWVRTVESTELADFRHVQIEIIEDTPRGGRAILTSYLYKPVRGGQSE
ncbi:MAG TPA: type II secretion system protein GspI [Halothiobacillus sp.]|nr:type II secretion system protein GspI [Halothiobacillus sp.]